MIFNKKPNADILLDGAIDETLQSICSSDKKINWGNCCPDKHQVYV